MAASILVLEDDELMLETLVELLQAEGYQTVGVNASTAALEQAKAKRFDLMVCDVRMEGPLDGIGTVAHIKQNLQPHLLVLVMTGYADDTAPYRAMDAEVDGYIYKNDFKISNLLWAVQSTLKQTEQRTFFRSLLAPILSAPRQLLQSLDQVRYDRAREKLDQGRLAAYRRYTVGIQSRQLEMRPALDIWDVFDRLERLYPILDQPQAMGDLYEKYQAVQSLIVRREASPFSPPQARAPGQVDRAAFQILFDKILRQQINATEVQMAETLRQLQREQRLSDDFQALYARVWEKG